MSSITDRLIAKFNSTDVISFAAKDNFKDMKSWAGTGSPTLEKNLGVLGFPTGIIEIAGKSRSGKTTLGLQGMRSFLRDNENGVAVILSSENRDNKEYATKMGIDTSRIIIIKVRYVEQMFLQVKNLLDETTKIFS